ncbi:MAG: hypothetical protein Q4Q06_08085 [Bacteroidota bacterium]|nr:hypothetical protein [Bacteroidota bacterium]
MKKTFLILLLIICSWNLFSQNSLFDLAGDKTKIDYNQQTIAIAYSSMSCHSCYDDIHKFFVSKDIYNKFNVIVFANIDKKDNKNLSYKRQLYNKMKEHFPLCNNIYFNSKRKGKSPVFFSKRMTNYLLPNIFVIKEGKLQKYYSSSEQFLKVVELCNIWNSE